ncbi:delta-sarcoglycan isoform X1 [Melopsittacus undulatus]|uniref:Uncharacterized protein n=1 Tax=Melopsittacus undulatus TaxID=13146 RepID=A0A8C6IR87_MELUD|nr:delta-sarcoglycan isoform X1 [Melopsittacus undulatus]XP_033922511.1 delta-sarcoglycan isoform X1 [Melopsittacus undulatus]XP_033922512.1 delta-sarcoglycan isoform X1 [Melopsittacus undulatus]
MPQEQYAHRSTMQTSEGPQVYKVGIYGWRKRCLYFFVLLLMILILVNLAMTIWILKVMNFTIDGMGNLRITEKGLKLEGDSEFLKPLYAKEIRSRPGNPLYFQSARNVTVNILNEKTKVLTRLITGPQAVEAHSQKFEVKTLSGKLLFSADDNEVVVGAERLRVLEAVEGKLPLAQRWLSAADVQPWYFAGMWSSSLCFWKQTLYHHPGDRCLSHFIQSQMNSCLLSLLQRHQEVAFALELPSVLLAREKSVPQLLLTRLGQAFDLLLKLFELLWEAAMNIHCALPVGD